MARNIEFTARPDGEQTALAISDAGVGRSVGVARRLRGAELPAASDVLIRRSRRVRTLAPQCSNDRSCNVTDDPRAKAEVR